MCPSREMGYSSFRRHRLHFWPFARRARCLGRSVTSWTNVLNSWRVIWMVRRWRRCAASSGYRARPATRSSTATRSGLEGLRDRSRRPYRHANQMPFQIEKLIVRIKQDKPQLGRAEDPGAVAPAAIRMFMPGDQDGACGARSPWSGRAPQAAAQQGHTARALSHARCAQRVYGAPITRASSCWRDRRYCYPLTISDFPADTCWPARRFAPPRRSLPSPCSNAPSRIRPARRIRTDNGFPFASPNALFNLTKLSVWWLRLGIAIERIKPGHARSKTAAMSACI